MLSNVDYIFVWPKNPNVFLQLWCKLKLKWVFFGGCLGFINRLFPSATKISTNINPIVHFKSIQETSAANMRFFIHIFTQTNEIWLRLYSDIWAKNTTKVTGRYIADEGRGCVLLWINFLTPISDGQGQWLPPPHAHCHRISKILCWNGLLCVLLWR